MNHRKLYREKMRARGCVQEIDNKLSGRHARNLSFMTIIHNAEGIPDTA